MTNPEVSTSDSILLSVKKMVGIPDFDESFDPDILIHINGAASTLFQLGVLEKPFIVESAETTYADMFPEGPDNIIAHVKLYFSYKTKLGFDPFTTTAAVVETIKESIKELEYRLMIEYNPKKEGD